MGMLYNPDNITIWSQDLSIKQSLYIEAMMFSLPIINAIGHSIVLIWLINLTKVQFKHAGFLQNWGAFSNHEH